MSTHKIEMGHRKVPFPMHTSVYKKYIWCKNMRNAYCLLYRHRHIFTVCVVFFPIWMPIWIWKLYADEVMHNKNRFCVLRLFQEQMGRITKSENVEDEICTMFYTCPRFLSMPCLIFDLLHRFLLHLAEKTGGVIVTNDNLRDFVNQSEAWRRIIQER